MLICYDLVICYKLSYYYPNLNVLVNYIVQKLFLSLFNRIFFIIIYYFIYNNNNINNNNNIRKDVETKIKNIKKDVVYTII